MPISTCLGEEELKAEKNFLFSKNTDKKLTVNEMIAQAIIFFVAGYDTTATTLTWCCYELALNPESQERLYGEIKSAMDSDGDFDYDRIAKLEYLDSVVCETLRMHNPATRLNRICLEDCKLTGTDIVVEKGLAIDISVHAIHHSEEYFTNPHKFDPERFMPENRHKIKPYTYLPFGAGPRGCIGMRFALMETKIALAYVISQFKLSKSPQTPVPPRTVSSLFLNSPKTLFLNIERR